MVFRFGPFSSPYRENLAETPNVRSLQATQAGSMSGEFNDSASFQSKERSSFRGGYLSGQRESKDCDACPDPASVGGVSAFESESGVWVLFALTERRVHTYASRQS